ncbi:hypothetical protein DPMN_054383 [Dreissena polymorpha]|uniref:Uncharacterized protein n=1 Tax=Dreissena polymorpha TaxID=45954 RepID=A0A9D4HPQ3_DREPO|nr:hypothetical protein DPMN_054383 [Dreissena polymorpha]
MTVWCCSTFTTAGVLTPFPDPSGSLTSVSEPAIPNSNELLRIGADWGSFDFEDN